MERDPGIGRYRMPRVWLGTRASMAEWCDLCPEQINGPANNAPQLGTGMGDFVRSTSNPISLNQGNRSRFMATLSTATVALAS